MYQNQQNAACIPFNFAQLEAINEITGDLSTTLLYAMLRFQTQKSKLSSHGTQTIARSRDQLASFLNLTPSKIDKMVKKLETLNLIRKTVSTWFSKKRLFISTVTEAPDIEVHFRKLMFLNQYTGNYRASLLWAKIAFALQKSTIQHNDITWCSLKRETLAKLLCVSLRTVDNIIDGLVENGLIQVENFVWHGKRCLHFSIPAALHTQIVEELNIWLNKKENDLLQNLVNTAKETQNSVTEEKRGEETQTIAMVGKKEAKAHFCREEPAKMKKSIRLNKKIPYKNNNTLSTSCSKKEHIESDINLNNITATLNKRQLYFLQSAFNKTLQETRLTVSNKEELFEEIKYSILNPEQRRGVSTFKHAVSRCMQLLRQQTWRTPFGFHRYTDYGLEIKAHREAQLQSHEVRKQEECDIPRSNVFKTSTVTEECIRWAKQLSGYLAEMNIPGHNSTGMQVKIEFAGKKIVELMNRGADKLAIKAHLPTGLLI